LHDAHVRADLEQRLVDAAQVAGAVVKQSNHEPRLCLVAPAGNREMDQYNFVHIISINWLEVMSHMHQECLLNNQISV
jgi:hypothetical protein